MRKILTKKTRISKNKKSGVLKIQDKKFQKFIGKEVIVEVSK